MALTLRMCEIVSDLEHLTADSIKAAIGEHCNCIDKWLYILHDKDVNDDGTPKYKHYHVYLHFNAPQKVEYIAKWFGVGEPFVSRIKGRFADAVEYAQHRNAPEKHQYSDSEVTANFDFVATIEKNEADKEKRQTIGDIIARIDSGEIKPYNITDAVSMADYVKYGKQIRTAFEYRLKRLERMVDRKMDVIYIYGNSGTGKTTYAKMIAQEKGYEIFTSSGTNDPFDGYKGEECVILDDLRGSVFPLADLLKILDNNTASSVKARYKNITLECKLLIITTTKDMKSFYKQVFESNGEEFRQFTRRCGQVARLTEKTMDVYVYDKNIHAYEHLMTVPNPVAAKLKMDAFEKQKSKEHALELFGLLSQSVDGMAQAVSKLTDDLSGFETILSIDDYDKNDDDDGDD